MNEEREEELVATVISRLRSFSTRQMLRMSAWQYFGIPLDLTDSDAMRIFRRGMKAVEGDI